MRMGKVLKGIKSWMHPIVYCEQPQWVHGKRKDSVGADAVGRALFKNIK